MKQCSRLARIFTARKRKFLGENLALNSVNFETVETRNLDGSMEMACEKIIFKTYGIAEVVLTPMRLRHIKKIENFLRLNSKRDGTSTLH